MHYSLPCTCDNTVRLRVSSRGICHLYTYTGSIGPWIDILMTIHRGVSSIFIIKFKIKPFHYSSNNLCWWNLISSGKCICWWLNQLPNCHQSSRSGCTIMRVRLEAKDGKEEITLILVFQNISDFLVVGRQQVGDK